MTIAIRSSTSDDDSFIAESFRRMWLDIGMAEADLVEDAHDRVIDFIAHARAELEFCGAIAEQGGERVGCAAAQCFAGLYPLVLQRSVRKYGYVWGVWVAAEQRRTGLGRRLTEHCTESLRAKGCTRVLLHASPMGRSVYEALGFTPTNELGLSLSPAAAPPQR
jgi:ribosomal protein S18 acetylase RimI-like enzyme